MFFCIVLLVTISSYHLFVSNICCFHLIDEKREKFNSFAAHVASAPAQFPKTRYSVGEKVTIKGIQDVSFYNHGYRWAESTATDVHLVPSLKHSSVSSERHLHIRLEKAMNYVNEYPEMFTKKFMINFRLFVFTAADNK